MHIPHPTMLITDDDGAFRTTLQSVFAPRGFRTLLASDGNEAMDIVRHEPIHLLLTDMHMPRMSGLEIIRRIRDAQLEIPCILISAGVDSGLVEEARHVEAFSILSKPIRYQEIVTVVNDAMHMVYGWPDSKSGETDGDSPSSDHQN